MKTEPLILAGKECPYCGNSTDWVSDSEVYRVGFGGMVYLCRPCDAYVGCHKPRPHESMGRLANKELRSAKIEAHASFDALWRRKIGKEGISKSKARNMAYKWLSEAIGISLENCHIGFMDIDECKKVIEACEPFLKYRTQITGSWINVVKV